MWELFKAVMASVFIFFVAGCGSGGGASAPVDTSAQDRSPISFSFIAQDGVSAGEWIVSNEVKILDIDSATVLTVENGEFSINGGDFEAGSITVNHNDRLIVRMLSSEEPAKTSSALVTIGTFSTSFSVTTAHDSLPDLIMFASQENIAAGTWAISNEVIVQGLSQEVSLSIVNGEYSLNGGDFTANTGSIENGDRLRLRALAKGNLTKTNTVIEVGEGEFTFSVESKADSEAPEIKILFPSANSYTDSQTVLVRAAVKDAGLVQQVQINGVDAILSADNTSWTAEISLDSSSTDLNVIATDFAGNSREIRSLSHVLANPALIQPLDLAVNPLTGEVLVLDSVLETLVGISSDNSSGRLLFNNATQELASLGNYPTDIVFDDDSNRVFILEREGKRILVFNLIDKSLTVFSSNRLADSGVPFGVVCSGLILDKESNRLITLDLSERALIAVDIDTGYRSILSKEDDSSGVGFTLGRRLALDNSHNRVLFIQSTSVVQVDLITRERSYFSIGSLEANFSELVDIEIDSNNGRALVLDAAKKQIFAINLETQIPTLFAGLDYGQSNNFLERPVAMSFNEDGTKIMVVDAELGEVIAVDLETREQTIFSSLGGKDQGQTFSQLENINLADNTLFALGESLFEVDLQTGAREVVSDRQRTELGPRWSEFPADLAVDVKHGFAYILDHNQDAIYSVNLLDGTRSIISSRTKPNSDNEFLSPFGIALDSDNSQLYVSDASLRALLTVDIATGQRTIVSDDSIGLGPSFNFAITDIAYDKENKVVLVNDINADRVISVDLTTGDRSALTQPVFRDHRAITIDSENKRAFVADRVNLDVKQVDLNTGVVTTITNNSMHNGRNSLKNPAGIVFDAINDRILVADADLEAIIAVDPVTGDRVIFSR